MGEPEIRAHRLPGHGLLLGAQTEASDDAALACLRVDILAEVQMHAARIRRAATEAGIFRAGFGHDGVSGVSGETSGIPIAHYYGRWSAGVSNAPSVPSQDCPWNLERKALCFMHFALWLPHITLRLFL